LFLAPVFRTCPGGAGEVRFGEMLRTVLGLKFGFAETGLCLIGLSIWLVGSLAAFLFGLRLELVSGLGPADSSLGQFPPIVFPSVPEAARSNCLSPTTSNFALSIVNSNSKAQASAPLCLF
jgi:hypothetical protein